MFRMKLTSKLIDPSSGEGPSLDTLKSFLNWSIYFNYWYWRRQFEWNMRQTCQKQLNWRPTKRISYKNFNLKTRRLDSIDGITTQKDTEVRKYKCIWVRCLVIELCLIVYMNIYIYISSISTLVKLIAKLYWYTCNMLQTPYWPWQEFKLIYVWQRWQKLNVQNSKINPPAHSAQHSYSTLVLLKCHSI